MAKLVVSNSNQLQQDLVKEVIKELNKILKGKFPQELEEDIVDLFIKYLRRHKVVLGLTGFYAGDEDKDYQAIFGLETSKAIQAIQEMEEAVRAAIRISFKVNATKKSITYTVTFYYEDLELAIRSIPSGEYTYNYKEVRFAGNKVNVTERPYTLPWLDWLLDGAEVNASLEFDVDKKELDESRSGRATMHRTGSGWDWLGVNFIEEIALNPKFARDLEKLVGVYVTDTIKKVAS